MPCAPRSRVIARNGIVAHEAASGGPRDAHQMRDRERLASVAEPESLHVGKAASFRGTKA